MRKNQSIYHHRKLLRLRNCVTQIVSKCKSYDVWRSVSVTSRAWMDVRASNNGDDADDDDNCTVAV